MPKSWTTLALAGAMLAVALAPIARAATLKCAADSVKVGNVCIDKYEASVWKVPAALTSLIKKIQKGSVTVTDLTSPAAVSAGVLQLGLAGGDLVAAGCPATGNGCVGFYAVSVPGTKPAASIDWFQAAAIARNSGKRLPTNQEWQVAALGTPDGAPCNVSTSSRANTGSAAGCISDVGVFDMVGNVWEWVADWVPLSGSCPGWGAFSDDRMCFGGTSPGVGPAALLRGGSSFLLTDAGVFAVGGQNAPTAVSIDFGFRAAR
jgi:hypothetical protein